MGLVGGGWWKLVWRIGRCCLVRLCWMCSMLLVLCLRRKICRFLGMLVLLSIRCVLLLCIFRWMLWKVKVRLR